MTSSKPEAIETPFSTVGYITYKRTYSRKLKEDALDGSPTEDFHQTVDRVIKACRDQLKVGFTPEEEARLRKYMLQLKCSVAGRFWWQLGTKTVDRLGLASLQNCAFTVVDHPIVPFTWCMDMLALGSGVGYNIQNEHVSKIPAVKKWFKPPTRVDNGGADFIIPDSREGWVRFLAKTLKAAFLSERKEKGTFTYSTQVVRGKGTPIKGFGGIASGPEDLVWGINKISEILMKRRGKKVRPIDTLDIMNIIGHIIVAGNVRRSAQIAIGDPDDIEFLLSKRWDLGTIPSWRAMSNNSVVCHDIADLHEYFWDGYEGKGEPFGLINLELSRAMGRLGETQYPDPGVQGYNPCLTGDTIVHTEHGEMRLDLLIEKFNSGESINVQSFNLENKMVELKPVAFGAMTRKDAELIQINLVDGSILKLTRDHKVYTDNRGYVEAKDLSTNDMLVHISKQDYLLSSRVHSFTKIQNEEVYDITVDDNHNFFANGVLVHNCAEQSLEPYETCCLAEVFISNVESEEEFKDILSLLYRVAKHSLTLPAHHPETNDIVHKNMRMGIGLTGIMQASKEQMSWSDAGYKHLRAFDVEYSADNGFNPSIKLTTVKPSGTLSLLPGVTPGIHPGYAQYMFRRIRIAAGHQLVQVCKDHGYPTEYQKNLDGTEDYNTIVVTFPFSYPEGTRLASEMTAIDQLEAIKDLQTIWSDNSVSCTVYYRKEELPVIREYLTTYYKDNHKSLSFLLHSGHGFLQAPFEEVTKEQFDDLVSRTRVITSVSSAEFEGSDECASGVCPVR